MNDHHGRFADGAEVTCRKRAETGREVWVRSAARARSGRGSRVSCLAVDTVRSVVVPILGWQGVPRGRLRSLERHVPIGVTAVTECRVGRVLFRSTYVSDAFGIVVS